MSARTDVHRPTEMDPTQYRYIFAEDNQTEWFRCRPDGIEMARKIAADDELRRGVYRCHHCGARIRYFAVMEYLPTGKYIVIGETCLDNRFKLASKAEFQALRKAAQLDRERRRIKTAAASFVDRLSGLAAQLFARETEITELIPELADEVNAFGRNTILDMRTKLWDRYGSLSDRQIAFAVKLAEEAKDRVEQRAAERKVDAPTGRCTTTGEVIKVDHRRTEFGPVTKLTIKVETADGVWRGWVTKPTALGSVERGDYITLTATWTPADDDPSFAFGKRPAVKKETDR